MQHRSPQYTRFRSLLFAMTVYKLNEDTRKLQKILNKWNDSAWSESLELLVEIRNDRLQLNVIFFQILEVFMTNGYNVFLFFI